ncbi:hypothetical protein LINGRAHAP2_LOCUS4680, partial [Linum grandiflorum]
PTCSSITVFHFIGPFYGSTLTFLIDSSRIIRFQAHCCPGDTLLIYTVKVTTILILTSNEPSAFQGSYSRRPAWDHVAW